MTRQAPLIPSTLAEQRARFSHDDLAFCTSYLLYILIEKGTRPDDPDWVEIASTTGEVDLMKYYTGNPHYPASRTVASEIDALALLWLARIRFSN
jgi:hypothetical protein